MKKIIYLIICLITLVSCTKQVSDKTKSDTIQVKNDTSNTLYVPNRICKAYNFTIEDLHGYLDTTWGFNSNGSLYVKKVDTVLSGSSIKNLYPYPKKLKFTISIGNQVEYVDSMIVPKFDAKKPFIPVKFNHTTYFDQRDTLRFSLSDADGRIYMPIQANGNYIPVIMKIYKGCQGVAFGANIGSIYGWYMFSFNIEWRENTVTK